ncbi:hypothetical protein M8C21_005917 [Ambrosia artemisiifolia]|uniref:Uncharacterized protein n=1 Tax=Ambrosia artemisiifolia TaxID=4212 RepID=A0AAD5CU96_AMBAR|nr:hypothetical protein M8C21_005917 [Ambrosia artemisiifolia]
MKMRFEGGVASFLAIVFALVLISSMMTAAEANKPRLEYTWGGSWKNWRNKEDSGDMAGATVNKRLQGIIGKTALNKLKLNLSFTYRVELTFQA